MDWQKQKFEKRSITNLRAFQNQRIFLNALYIYHFRSDTPIKSTAESYKLSFTTMQSYVQKIRECLEDVLGGDELPHDTKEFYPTPTTTFQSLRNHLAKNRVCFTKYIF